MPMINLSIGFDETNGKDPAGMCVLCRDDKGESHIQNLILGDKGESHIQNLILGEKAELIYKLLTTPTSKYSIRTCGPNMDYVEIEFFDKEVK